MNPHALPQVCSPAVNFGAPAGDKVLYDTAGPRYQQSRSGWAAQTLTDNCYDGNGKPRHYLTTCERKYSWGTAKEDYVLPEAHTVIIQIAPNNLAGLTGDCTWTWQPRKG